MDEPLHRRPADALGRRAVLLPLDQCGVQHATDVLHHVIREHRDGTGLPIDADANDVPGDRRREARHVGATLRLDRLAPRPGVGADELRNRDGLLRRAPRLHAAVDELEVLDGDLELERRRLEQPLADGLGGPTDRASGGVRDRAPAAAR